jgi:molecular chaperone DnaK (HSP70)
MFIIYIYRVQKNIGKIIFQNDMKKITEIFIRKEVKEAVIIVTAYFSAFQKRATKDAGKLVGLNVLRIINKLTSAAIAFKLNNAAINNKYALIFDLGTFDVSILLINQDDISVIITKGITHLGGIDFDERLLNLCIKLFKEETNIDLSNNEIAKNKIRKQCEDLKKALFDANEVCTYIDNMVKILYINKKNGRQ